MPIEKSIIGEATILFPELCNIWQSVIGDHCKIAAFCEIGRAVIGNRVSIQGFVYICPNVLIEDDVFIGPRVTFINDRYPPSAGRWKKSAPTHVMQGASIGAGAIIFPGVKIGKNARIAAGAVVTHDVLEGDLSYGALLHQIRQVLTHGWFVNGPEVTEFERAMANYIGVEHATGCNSGTDALILALKAAGIGPGDKVAVPAFTFQATASAVCLAGATPVFADIKEDNFAIDVNTIQTDVKAVIGVDLFGIPADWDEINSFAEDEHIPSIEDAAQAIGSSLHQKKCGSLADIGCTSFYPAKPLGGIGDGGMVFTDHRQINERVQTMANHGRNGQKYSADVAGMNSRLDSIQAAVLIQHLRDFDTELKNRNQQAMAYYQSIGGTWRENCAWAWYPVLYPTRNERDRALANHADYGATVIYPTPLPHMKAFKPFSTACPVAESVCERILSFPIQHSWELRK